MFDAPSILPPNHSALEATLEQVIRATKPDLTSVSTLMDPDTCPAELLGWLAWSFSVDVWNPEWDETAKRRVIKNSLEVHRRKGTAGAMRRALEALFDQARLQEWFETGAAPHSFQVSVSGVVRDATDIAAAKAIIERTKPVRSHMTVIQVQSDQEATLRFGTAVAVRISQNVDAVFPRAVLAQFTGAALSQFIKQEIPSNG